MWAALPPAILPSPAYPFPMVFRMSRAPTICCAAAFLALVCSAAARAGEPSLAREVVPTLYKLGCSAGQCHGSFSGKGNFRLSLFAADPQADYLEIHGGFGRRINRLQPEASLLLLKPTSQVPHGGGVRLTRGSPEYQLLLAWIEAARTARPGGCAESRVGARRAANRGGAAGCGAGGAAGASQVQRF